jgi:hypothetical protein
MTATRKLIRNFSLQGACPARIQKTRDNSGMACAVRVDAMVRTTVLCVKPGIGRWHVVEQGYEKSIAFFLTEEEAVAYAISFGKTKPDAIVRVLDERGEIIRELDVAMGPPK